MQCEVHARCSPTTGVTVWKTLGKEMCTLNTDTTSSSDVWILLNLALMRKIFRPKRDEVIGWRKLHNEELHNLHCSPSIIRMIKSRRMRRAGHVARMGKGGMHTAFWCESQKERGHLEDLDVGGRIILEWILETQGGVVWTGLIWLRIGTSGGPL
jgi:hypothetical protein